MEAKLKAFLAKSPKHGYGYGSGSGSGYGSGFGDGCGSGYGSGSGDGCGSGYGSGDGSGYGSGFGDGTGFGDGSGCGYGDGTGFGDGDGYDISAIGGHTVALIDGVQTVLYAIHGNVAKGAILWDDLTTQPCYVVKGGDCFAHGETLRKAQNALERKLFKAMPVKERIDAFMKQFKPGTEYPNKQFWDWHNRLTGSCEMGRNEFARQHAIDVENGSMTPEAFISLTENAYGRDVIRALKQAWKEKYGGTKP